MKTKKLILVIFILMLFSMTTPVLAAPANPDDITAWQPKVYENIWEDDDMLFVIEYDIEYASEPSESASTTFLVQLKDSVSGSLILSRPINYYQHNLISLYADADYVDSSNITWGTAYQVIITGNPALFGTITEGVNKVTKTLSSSDYNVDGSVTSDSLLRDYCIDVAEALETDWAVTLISTTVEGEQVLNSTGTTTFLDAIPSLDDALPSLFILSAGTVTVDTTVATANYSRSSSISNRLGTDLSNSLSGVGDFLGIGDNSAAGLWAIVTILVISSIVFLSTGDNVASLVLAVPAIVMMTYLGAIPEAITYVITIFVVIYAMYFFWLRGT